MMVRFVCRSCGQKFKANEEYAGQASQCPACGVMVQIPVAPATHSGPVPVEPEMKQDILKFKPVFNREPAPVQNIVVPEQNIPAIDSTPVPESPKLKMRLRTSPELNDNASTANNSLSVIEPEASSQLRMPGNVPPSSGIKMPAAMKAPAANLVKPQAAAPKQAFPVGFTPVSPKLPPGLTLIEE
jgi:DNA-directed RNA polymerase subunit RPC12/RpoP